VNVLTGEVRQVGIEVISTISQSFTISTADYSIENRTTGEISSTGTATIDGNKILTLFTGSAPGKYQVVFTYRIGPEILKAIVYVDVT
jgi:hypothetical protein